MNYIPKMFALPPKLVAISYMCGAIYAYINMHDLCCAFAVTYEGGERGLLIFFQLFTTFNFFFHLTLLPSQGSQQATYVMAWTGDRSSLWTIRTPNVFPAAIQAEIVLD